MIVLLTQEQSPLSEPVPGAAARPTPFMSGSFRNPAASPAPGRVGDPMGEGAGMEKNRRSTLKNMVDEEGMPLLPPRMVIVWHTYMEAGGKQTLWVFSRGWKRVCKNQR